MSPTRRRSNRKQSGNQPATRSRRTGADFWGRSNTDEAPAVERIRPTPEPGALVRSLGDPPLGPNPAAAQHHLSAVYEEAVRTAIALAAANGLLDLEETAES